MIDFGSCGGIIGGCSKNGLIRCTILPFTCGVKYSVSALAVLTRDRRGFGCGLLSFLLKTNENKTINHKFTVYKFSYLLGSIAVIIAAVVGRVSRYVVEIIVDDDDGSTDVDGE